MIYDCFSFFNELDLLEIRLNVLKDVVDRFVLVEAGETHTGKPKPFYFEENRGRFAAFADRIIYLKIEKFPAGHGAWWNENYQRNEIATALADAGAKDDDWILVSDLDEIPDPTVVAKCARQTGVYQFRPTSFGFYLNMLDYRTPYTWGTKMLSCWDMRTAFDGVETYYDEFLPEELNSGTTVTKVRRRKVPSSHGGEQVITGAGWHFTCLGGARAVLAKMRAVAPHLGFDPDDPDLTEESVTELLAKGQSPGLKMNCFAIPVDRRLPEYIRNSIDRYRHLVFEITPEYRRQTRILRKVRWLQGRWIALCLALCPAWLLAWMHQLKVRLRVARTN